MQRTARSSAAIAALTVSLLLPGVAGTQLGPAFDHLQCFRVKDPAARGTATADLVPERQPPFLTQNGCKIKLPAKYYCTDVSKQNLQPPPALAVGGDDARDYFCYRLTCPKATTPTGGVFAADQFGDRVVTMKRSSLLCVPAVRALPTPTAPTPTPTLSPTSTPTMANDPGCAFDGVECQGACFTATRCLFDPGQQRCICPQVFDLECNQFAQGGCGGHLCYGPGQVCAVGPQPTAGAPCHCVYPTPQPTP